VNKIIRTENVCLFILTKACIPLLFGRTGIFFDAGSAALPQEVFHMSKKHEHSNDDPITFTLGKGNQSSICGGVAPMVVDSAEHDLNANPTEAENVGRREIRPDADSEIRLP
jgi:hypothetical protein